MKLFLKFLGAIWFAPCAIWHSLTETADLFFSDQKLSRAELTFGILFLVSLVAWLVTAGALIDAPPYEVAPIPEYFSGAALIAFWATVASYALFAVSCEISYRMRKRG